MSEKSTMTLLSACSKGGMATVCKINATGPLKQRLVSFGLMRGVDLVMMECSPTKSTFEVKVGTLNIALRKEEAALIEVCNVR